MASVNSVNGNSNSNAAEKAAELSKQNAEKAAERNKQNAEKAAEAAKKTDNVEISEKAEKLSKGEKTETTSIAQNNDDKVEETGKKATAAEKATADKPQDIRDVIKEKKAEVKQVKRDLKEIGVDKKEIKQIERDAKKEAYASIKDDIKQVSKDYKSHKIDRKELKNAMYGIAAKQLDGIISSMKDAYNQKTEFINNNNDSTQAPRKSIFSKKADAPTTSTPDNKASIFEAAASNNKEKNAEAKAADKKDDKTAMEAKPAINTEPKIKEKATPPGLAKKEEVPPGQEVKAEKAEAKAVAKAEKVEKETATKLEKALKAILKEILKSEKSEEKEMPPGLESKSEAPGNSQNASGKIEEMFNAIDKMVTELDNEEEGADEKSGLGEFVSGLKEMFGSGAGVEGNSFLKNLNKVADEHGTSDAHKVGMETIKAETLSGLLKGGDANSNFGINRVGDNGEGSGNFSAVNFMSDMSNNVSEGLDSYKDAKEAREAAAENVAGQTGAEAQLSEVA